MVGLSGPRKRQKIGNDPRNTTWSNDLDRFGHKHLAGYGWTPGQALGRDPTGADAMATNIKIEFKEDTMGLGAKAHLAATQNAQDWCPGLDSFQSLLSRLNKSPGEAADEPVQSLWETEKKISQTYTKQSKWGSRVQFVKGDDIKPTIFKLPDVAPIKRDSSDDSDSDSSSSSSDTAASEVELEKPAEKTKKAEKATKAVKASKEDKSEKSPKAEKTKAKADKPARTEKAKADKPEKADKAARKAAKAARKAAKAERRAAREAKRAAKASKKKRSKTPEDGTPVRSLGRLAHRARYIANKKAAVQDAQSLKEIFMAK
ncbi:putative g-patch RNA maturation protein [Dipodascopsis tothii]|uniref:putative g-patch RNA maturation protein n=1 Tax=Dipodascopsis tothii TaxID=44089 RepID=UPI0034CE80DE